MKLKSYLIHGGIALACVIALLVSRGLFTAETIKDKLLIASDSVFAVAAFWVGFGLLVWISSTGVFDMMSYALKSGAHALVPGLFKNNAADFYEYKVARKENRKKGGYGALLVVGLALLAIAFILVFCWYNV